MDILGNVNRVISIVGYCISDSNYEEKLCLKKYSLDIVCSLSVGEEQVAAFFIVIYAVRYMWTPINPQIG